jgi:creatinine amidohydrolase
MAEPFSLATGHQYRRTLVEGARLLGAMSWTEARDVLDDNPIVLLPVGAVEEHGPHLPLDEDALVADRVAQEISARTNSIVAPLMPYGYSPNLRGYTGTISLSHDTLTAVISDVCSELIRHGFRRIVIVDNNGGNASCTAEAAFKIRQDHGILVGGLYPWGLGYSLMKDQYDDALAAYGHGAEPELSAMMALFPEEVRSHRIPVGGLLPFEGWKPTDYLSAAVPGHPGSGSVFWDFSSISPTGVTGDTSKASPELGLIWIERVIGLCVDFVREFDRNTASAVWAQKPQ